MNEVRIQVVRKEGEQKDRELATENNRMKI